LFALSVSVYLWRAIDSLRDGNKFSAEDWDVYGEVSILGEMATSFNI
jgi:hypothetical protein